ncbi:MAG: thioredoxin domain-containing protein [Bacteroidia bacterium]|nr:thioredoxin domain-containing protein [Bacteroidia bacterium]
MEKTKHKYTNHLINESSPYLLQHAHNPVDWYPWGEEALKKAKDENKILLISIGYAACHWCHVMEHESFENEEVAKLMNEYFVPIKVDREERPDIDQIYMSAVQLMTGSGGWPLNCFALPDGRPFYGGTYFPKQNWLTILQKVYDEYKTNPAKVEEFANKLTTGVKQSELISYNSQAPAFSISLLDETVEKWANNFDNKEGGPNRAPKFPIPNNYHFLLRYYYHKQDQEILDHVLLTLNKMAFGGIYDQLGGGFARYSTDKVWKAPHFEKMLYDNGQLVSLYSEAYQLTKDPLYKQIVYETIEFIQRELTSPEFGFYSSLDADSEGEEGKFYVWTRNELEEILGDDEPLFSEYYNVTYNGNWEHYNNILLRQKTDKEFADKHKISVEDLREKLISAKKKVFKVRSKRIRPGLDDKVLTEWNALMLKGYIDAHRAFNDDNLLKEALKNAKFITDNMLDGSRLNRNYKNGKSTINGYLSDYSFTIEAFIALYEVTFDESWLLKAKDLMDYTINHFYDAGSNMFYFTSDEDPALIARKMEVNDNVIPASNSSIAKGLFILGNLFDNADYLEMSTKMLNNIQQFIPSYGSGYSNWGMLFLNMVYSPYEIAIVGKDAVEKRKELDKNFIPNKLILGGDNEGSLPLLKMKAVKGKTMIYVCKNKSCKLPVENVSEALEQMNEGN